MSSSPGSTTPSPAGMPTRPRSPGTASATSADNGPADGAGPTSPPSRSYFNRLRRDPLALPAGDAHSENELLFCQPVRRLGASNGPSTNGCLSLLLDKPTSWAPI